MRFLVRVPSEIEESFREVFPSFQRHTIISKITSKNEVTNEEVSTDSINDVLYKFFESDEEKIKEIIQQLKEYKRNNKSIVIVIQDDKGNYPPIPLTSEGFVAPFSQALFALQTIKIKDLKEIQAFVDLLNQKYIA